MIGKRFYTEEEMAEIMRIQPSTLQNKRYLGAGHPPYKKINGIILYPVKDAEAWLDGFQVCRELAAQNEQRNEIRSPFRSKTKAG